MSTTVKDPNAHHVHTAWWCSSAGIVKCLTAASPTSVYGSPECSLSSRLGTAPGQVVLLDDVDFIVSPGVAGPQQYEAIVQRTRARQALVLPALEPYEEVVGIDHGIQQTLQALAGERQ